MSELRILIAGIGNIFLGDDAFGVEVIQRLARIPLPAYVKVVDYGIRGLDLAYALMDGYDLTILVDAVGKGGEPGTLYVIEPELGETSGGAPAMDAHSMNPVVVLGMVKAMGGLPKRVLVVGCEPESLGDELEGRMGLSATVVAALDGAVSLVKGLILKAAAEREVSRVA